MKRHSRALSLSNPDLFSAVKDKGKGKMPLTNHDSDDDEDNHHGVNSYVKVNPSKRRNSDADENQPDLVMINAMKRARKYHRGVDSDSDDDDDDDDDEDNNNDDNDTHGEGSSSSSKSKKATNNKSKQQSTANILPSAPFDFKEIENKKLKSRLQKNEYKLKDAAIKAARAEILLPSEAGYLEAEGMEKTYHFSQSQIAENVDLNSSNKIFNLDLPTLGPYRLDYSRDGRNLLIGGKKGHVAAFNWKTGRLLCELHLMETVRDVQWLHNETMFAAAQKKYVYIYDSTGTEIHCLRKHIDVNRLEFLPYHFLLVSVGNAGYLKYQDTSTGELVVEHRTKLGACNVMKQNPYNATILLGHHNGTVTLWSPNVTTPLVKMLCHKGPIQDVAVDTQGYYLTTAGLDGQMKIWDLRTYKQLHSYYTPTPASSLSISQQGMISVAHGPHVQIWKDALKTKVQSPYMSHLVAGSIIENAQFCPFEDVLGVGHSKGISSLLIPGSGEANYDALENNPYQTKKQRQEAEVKALLDKIQPEMITLDPLQIASVRTQSAHNQMLISSKKEKEEALSQMSYEPKHKSRGKSSTARRYRRKQSNVMDENKLALKKKLDENREKHQTKKSVLVEKSARTALSRFDFKK